MANFVDTKNSLDVSAPEILSLGAIIPEQLKEETRHAYAKLNEALGNDVPGFVANRLQLTPEQVAIALAAEQVDGVALAIYNIEARGQSVIIGDQTGIGKGRQAAALIRYGLLSGYIPIFLTDRYTLFSDMYRDCKALGIKDARPLILNLKASIVDFDNPVDEENAPLTDEIWTADDEDDADEEMMAHYIQHYEEVYKSLRKSELELMYRNGDIPKDRYEYVMLSYSQLKDARKDMTRLDFLTSLCEKHRVLFIFDEAHKSSSVSAGKISIITQGINSILETCPETQCVFLSATFAKRPECLVTFMRHTILNSLATSDTLQQAFSNGGVQMQEYVASMLAKEGQMIRREHSGKGIPEPAYTYLDDKLPLHAELFDKVMYWFREIVKLSDMVKTVVSTASMLGVNVSRPYPARAQLFYVNKILLLALKAKDVAEAAVRDVQAGRSVVIGMSDTLECILHDSIDPEKNECAKGDFSTILLRLLDKTLSNPKNQGMSILDMDLSGISDASELVTQIKDIRSYAEQIRKDINEDVFHLPLSPIDVIRQMITQESFTDKHGVTRNIRFEECTGRARQLEYLSPEGDDDFVNASLMPRKKRHTNHIYNDFQNNKIDVILINACGAIGASAHAVATVEVDETDVRQRKMLIVQNDLDVNTDLQKRGRINRTGQITDIPPLYEYIITAIPSEKRLNMMLRAKLRSLSANTTANQDQDKHQADFLDIINKYGNLVAKEFLEENQELAFVLGLNKTTTASQLLARISMLSVAAQQDIIEEIFGAYQNKEQELRRINQWDLEREYRDFEAEFVTEELFTAPIDDSVMGGASMLTTFRCRHRTYPFDALTLQQSIDKARNAYGTKLSQSENLRKEICSYYRAQNKKVRMSIAARKEKLLNTTLAALLKYNIKEGIAKHLVALTQYPDDIRSVYINKYLKDNPHIKRIKRKLESYQVDLEDLDSREKKSLTDLSDQRKRLMTVISKSIIGQGYYNIMNFLPVEEQCERIMAVLKEVRFDKNPDKRFLPGKVQFVFALSAVHKELVLNLVNKGSQNNYNLLVGILTSTPWNFNHTTWNSEISRYNNRILERKIITGNILGAYANPLIQKMKPHFITFSLSPDDHAASRTERGLLLPMSGENVDKAISNVTLPLGYGLKYATAINHVYRISGIGLDFTISPVQDCADSGKMKFYISVVDKDSRKFEADSRFDAIRDVFKGTQVTSVHNKNGKTSRRPLMRYATESLSFDSPEFTSLMTLLASLRAVILIPREYLTVGEMKDFANVRLMENNSDWPSLDWKNSTAKTPPRHEIQVRITAPVVKDSNIHYVEELPPHILLCKDTLSCHGSSFKDNLIPGQIRALYCKWRDLSNMNFQDENQFCWHEFASRIADNIYRSLVNSAKVSTILFDDEIYRKLKEKADEYQLSAVGKIIARFRNEMLFSSPSVEDAQKFLDECLYDSRLAEIRKSLECYINGKTDVILDS